VKGTCDKAYYDTKVKQLELLEQRSTNKEISLLYADEMQVSEEGYVPYGWQFRDEDIAIASARGVHINCFGMLAGNNDFVHATTTPTITADFIIEHLDRFSFSIQKHTVIVLDNARVHQNKKMKNMQKIWAKRKLFIFFLPPYCPHLNIIERLWKEVKARWLNPYDYLNDQHLSYALNRILNAIGKTLFLHFKPVPI
jgi:transposase